MRAAAQQGDPGAAQVLKEYLIAEQEHQQRLNRSPIVHAGFGEKEVAQTLGNQAMASGADSEAFRRVEENRRVAWPGDRPTPQVSADPRGDM
ncbi:MAG: hypothetical protein OEX14_05835, partial [Paracoccaceae bacterium]|nr:hypothetical protein [Paracoccaceae bacterium]